MITQEADQNNTRSGVDLPRSHTHCTQFHTHSHAHTFRHRHTVPHAHKQTHASPVQTHTQLHTVTPIHALLSQQRHETQVTWQSSPQLSLSHGSHDGEMRAETSRPITTHLSLNTNLSPTGKPRDLLTQSTGKGLESEFDNHLRHLPPGQRVIQALEYSVSEYGV